MMRKVCAWSNPQGDKVVSYLDFCTKDSLLIFFFL